MTDIELVYRCAAGRACRTKSGALVTVARGLCLACSRSVVSALCSLGEDLVMLDAAADDRQTGATEHVSGTPEPAIPLNTTVVELRATLSDWCEAALVAVAEVMNFEPRTRQRARGFPVREDRVILQAAQILPDNMTRLLDVVTGPVSVWNRSGTHWHTEDLDGIDIALRIGRVHWQIRSVLGESSSRRRLSMPCPVQDCGATTLGIDEDSHYVTCTSCGGHWSEALYNWLATFLVSEHKRSTEERVMLEWLLAEQTYYTDVGKWLVAQRDHTLDQVRRLAVMTQADLVGIDGIAVVELLREMMG